MSGNLEWKELVSVHLEFLRALQQFARRKDVVTCVSSGLHGAPADRAVAFLLYDTLPLGKKKSLLEPLLRCALAWDQTRARELLLKLPRSWLLTRIESTAEPLLAKGTYEDYRSLFALYQQLSPVLARNLARHASSHQDPDIHEAGQDFLKHVTL